MSQIDLVIIGAGWHGLAVAKTYLEVRPETSVMILDSAGSIGGVWAKERLYPGLKTNNLVGSYEFGDFPMEPNRYGIQAGQHIPGAVVHAYLNDFADHFDLTRRIRFRTKVNSAELAHTGEWRLDVTCVVDEDDTPYTSRINTRRLVVATGLTSEPFVPNITGSNRFRGHIIHSRDLKSKASQIEIAKEVVIVGGNKSAWDACYTAASNNVHVHLVMRPSGGGPSWVWPVTFTPLRVSIARLASTRFFTWFDPYKWTENDSYPRIRKLLHHTWLGQKIVSAFWTMLGRIAMSANGYDSHTELRKLRPWISPFWMGNSLGIHNYDSNWFDWVRKDRIQVHIADVESLGESTVRLSDGVELNADALICCTGWKVVPPIRFLPEGIETSLGLPISCKFQDAMTLKAKDKILKENPTLREKPIKSLPSDTLIPAQGTCSSDSYTRPYQLYRFLVPSEDKFLRMRNIAFIGSHLSINAIMLAQVQALWITAFFEGTIDHLKPGAFDLTEIQYQTVLHSEYCKLRHPAEAGGAGERCPDLLFDSIPYVDMLMCDMRLRKHRKNSIWDEMFSRYLPSDFRGLVQEWRTLNDY